MPEQLEQKLPQDPGVQIGLDPEQLQTAIELRQQIGEKATTLQEQENFRAEYPNRHYRHADGSFSGPSAAGLYFNDINHAVKKHQLNKAERAAKRHFKQNEGAYQEQALHDAREDGVDIVGWHS